MPSIAESKKNQSPLQGPLKQGLDTLSGSQTVTFTQYVKMILPLDGYVFWLRADLADSQVACNCWKYMAPDDGTSPPGQTLVVEGSLHYSTNQMQEEDQTAGKNTVVFTAESEVQDFNKVGPCVMYIAEFDGIRFAFNTRQSFYKQTNLYHYQGIAVWPALETQIIDDPTKLDTSNVIVSNSLPIWLSLNQFMPMYPSFLVKENLEPPYASVHIEPSSTEAIAARPLWGPTGSHSQLVKEKVRITLYGLRNFNALDFQDYVFQYSVDSDVFGVMNMPVMQDEKRTQSELGVIAQKKVFELEINYYQHRARNIARQLILKCVPECIIGELLE